MRRFHPTTLLLAFVLTTSLLWRITSPVWLGCAWLMVMVVGIALVPMQLRRMLWKMRWLLLTTMLFFFAFTPGEHVQVPGGEGISVSWEGLSAGLMHVARLSLFVGLLALLLEAMPAGRLVTGLHAAIRPLAWFGLDRDRAALRLMLVMHLLEQPEKSWRKWLLAETDGLHDVHMTVRLAHSRLGWQDFVLPAVLGVALWGTA